MTSENGENLRIDNGSEAIFAAANGQFCCGTRVRNWHQTDMPAQADNVWLLRVKRGVPPEPGHFRF